MICAAVPVMVTLAVPLPLTPGPAITWIVPLATLSVVVSALLSLSATETPATGKGVSSATLCALGTVLIGSSFSAVIASVVVMVVSVAPSDTDQVSVRCGLAPKSVGFSLVDSNATVCSSA